MAVGVRADFGRDIGMACATYMGCGDEAAEVFRSVLKREYETAFGALTPISGPGSPGLALARSSSTILTPRWTGLHQFATVCAP